MCCFIFHSHHCCPQFYASPQRPWISEPLLLFLDVGGVSQSFWFLSQANTVVVPDILCILERTFKKNALFFWRIERSVSPGTELLDMMLEPGVVTLDEVRCILLWVASVTTKWPSLADSSWYWPIGITSILRVLAILLSIGYVPGISSSVSEITSTLWPRCWSSFPSM